VCVSLNCDAMQFSTFITVQKTSVMMSLKMKPLCFLYMSKHTASHLRKLQPRFLSPLKNSDFV